MSKEPSGNIIFDTGALLEIVSGSALGAYAKDLLKSGNVLGFTNELNLGELQYLICRKSGEKKAQQAIKRPDKERLSQGDTGFGIHYTSC